MEIKAKLNKPYTEIQRFDFIAEYNHRLGFVIRESAEALEAWGYDEKEISEQEKNAKIVEIKQELEEIDLKSIRPLRAGESERLLELEGQAENLRKKIKELEE